WQSWVLLSALAAFFLAFLRLQQTRRIALWRAHARTRLAVPRQEVVLRESPLRLAAQIAWIAGLAGATILLTAWIAPHLWKDGGRGGGVAGAPIATGAGSTNVGTCCPTTPAVETPRQRVVEYLPLLRPHSEEPTSVGNRCVVCRDGVPIVDSPVGEPSTGSA